MPTDIMTRRSAEPMSGLNPDVMDGERLGELTPRAEPKDTRTKKVAAGRQRNVKIMLVSGKCKRDKGGCL